MPRENLENQEEIGRAATERGFGAGENVELTAEDRERIGSLISEFWGGSPRSYGITDKALDPTDSSELIELRNRLKSENGKAVRVIFELIKAEANAHYEGTSLEDAERCSFFEHSPLLMLAASRSDSLVFSDLLASPIILGDSDRSNRSLLFKILARIAGPENIEHIKTFVEKSFAAHYASERKDLVFYDIRSAFEMLETILMRDSDETETLTYDEKQEVLEAEEHIKRLLSGGGYPPIVEEDIVYFEEQYPLDKMKYENYFIPRPCFINLEQSFSETPYEYAWMGMERDHAIQGDIRQDQGLRSEYDEQHFREVESRLEVVKRLRHEAKKEKTIKDKPEDDDTKFLRRHWLELLEEKPSSLAPTLGIEIEIRESVAGVPKELRWPGPNYDSPERGSWLEEKDKFLKQAQKPYLKTRELGVPYAFDKFWEFAHKPVRYYHTLSREVQALMEMNLIDREDQKHPLHLTIGGITSQGDTGEEANILVRALEASAYSVRGRRLLRSYYAKKYTWTVKGYGGVCERYSEKLGLGVKRGVEFRTFQLQTITGLDRLLRSAYFLGAALKAYQRVNDAHPKGESILDEEIILADTWKDFSGKIKEIFLKFELPKPDLFWLNPDNTGQSQASQFFALAAMLDEAEADSKSRGAEFVKEIRKLIIGTRGKIAKIIYPETIR